METIDISKIKVKDNVRKAVGDLTDLTASIKLHGVKVPVILDKSNQLVDGHRRMKAASAAGMTKIPYVVTTDKDRTVEQLITNMQREGLHPLDEAESFQGYIKKTKCSAKTLADKLGKKQDYVERRLILNNLTPEARKEFRKGTFKINIAAAMARLDNEAQKEKLGDIKKGWVDDSSDIFSDTKYLGRAPFDKGKGPDGNGNGNTGCKGCPYNTGSQMLLLDVEEYEGTDGLQESCAKPGCYDAKVDAVMANTLKEAKEKNQSVMTGDDVDKLPHKKKVPCWENNHGLLKAQAKKGNKNYAIVYTKTGYGTIDEDVYDLRDQAEVRKQAAKKKGEPESNTNVQTEKLKNKVYTYAHEFYGNALPEMFNENSDYLANALIWQCLNSDWSLDSEFNDRLMKGAQPETKDIFEFQKAMIGKAFVFIAQESVGRMDLEDRQQVGKVLGLDLAKKWVIDKEFLQLHFKDQLLDLAKEIKLPRAAIEAIEKADSKKKRIELILAEDLKGKVPKVMTE